MDAVTGLFQPIGEQGGAALCGSVFKVEYTDCASGVSIYGYTAERCACGIRWPWPGEKS